MRQKAIVRSLVAVGILTAVIGGYSSINPSAFHFAEPSHAATIAVATAKVPSPVAAALPDFTSITEYPLT